MATPTYTKAELLAWLKDEKRMSKWDAIVALKREPTNTLLLQQYIENFNQGSYWSGIGGFMPTGGNDFTEAINDFTLDVPRLFYEDTGLDGSRANLEMAIIEENLKLNFGNTIVGNEVHSPGDVSFFGRITPDQISIAITTPELLLAAGDDPYPFQTQPVISGLRWTLEGLRPGARSTGSIDPSSGVYQVPQAGQIDGSFTRVRITATNPATNFRSSALVTVVADPLTVNPLFTYCSANNSGSPIQRVDLNIGVLGDGPVEVTVKNPGPGSGTIEEIEGVFSYVPGPKVDQETYVLDEVVATYKGQTKSVYMLVKQIQPMITLWPVASATQASPGQIQLKAEANNNDVTHLVEWEIAFNGPGHMDADIPGLYHADPNAEARFVCIIAIYDTVNIGVFKGHAILPLPFEHFPKEVDLLSHLQ